MKVPSWNKIIISKLRARNSHFPKYKKFYQSDSFIFFKLRNSLILKHKKFFKLGARKLHFLKYTKNFWRKYKKLSLAKILFSSKRFFYFYLFTYLFIDWLILGLKVAHVALKSLNLQTWKLKLSILRVFETAEIMSTNVFRSRC